MVVGSGSLNFFPHNQRITGFGFFKRRTRGFYERTGKKTHWFLEFFFFPENLGTVVI